VPSIERDVVPHSFCWVFLYTLRGVVGRRNSWSPLARNHRASSCSKAAAWNFEQPRPPGVAEPAPPVLPDTIPRHCAFTPLKDSVRYPCSLGQQEVRASAKVPWGNPRRSGVSAPPTTPRNPFLCAALRAPPPLPCEGKEQGKPPTRRVYASFATGRVSSWR
jgi:hypothetical protein